jgi:hypothetical protein
LPGAHHDFDLCESIRAAAINVALESFIERSGPDLRQDPLASNLPSPGEREVQAARPRPGPGEDW